MTAPTYTPAPVPSPGATAWLVAVETTTTPGGARSYTTTSANAWCGYTAANLRTHWAARAKAARWDHAWDDGALVVASLVTSKTITRTFHDEEPA